MPFFIFYVNQCTSCTSPNLMCLIIGNFKVKIGEMNLK